MRPRPPRSLPGSFMRFSSALRTWPPSWEASESELRSCGLEPRRAGEAELPDPRRPPIDGRRVGDRLRPPSEGRRCFGDAPGPPSDARRCFGDEPRLPMDCRRTFGVDPLASEARRARLPEEALPNDDRRSLAAPCPPLPNDPRLARGEDAALLMEARRAIAGMDTSLVLTVNDGFRVRRSPEACDPWDDLDARRASCRAPSIEPRLCLTAANDGRRPSPLFIDSRRFLACAITSCARLAATACFFRRAAL